MGLDIRRDIQGLKHLIVALEHLDGVPVLLLFGHGVHGSLFDVGNGVLDRAGELVHRDGLAALRGFDGGLGGFLDAVALQRGDLHDRAAELTGQLRNVDLVAILADDVHHVHRQHHGDAELGELRGEVKVTLKVRAVDDVQNGIGARADEVISRYDFLQRVGGQRINARKVGDDDTVMTFELAFLLLDRDARPVADELVGAGQSVEQGGFAAVRVARKGDAQIHFHASFLLSKAFPRFAFANRCSKKLGALPEKFLFDLDHLGVRLADRKLVVADGDFDGVAEGRYLADVDLGASRDAHVHDAALHRALAMELHDLDRRADRHFAQSFHAIASLFYIFFFFPER